jgi:serine protease AprX
LGWDQVKMLNVQTMHEKGFRGKGVWIAVLDAGFYNANILGAFDSLRANKQIIGSRDFVDRDNDVYNDDDHGTQVLGCMASNVPGIMVGTAPDASYLLLRTEDARSEFPSEEAQWLAGAEYADSVGVDMINSSLGYTEFDKSEFGHTYDELDGHTALITLAANMAYDRGIVIVNSAGNEGDEKWEKMGAPADAVGVIAVAAVDREGTRAGFSSMGPTYDKRMKPDLAALGKRAIIAGTSGYFYGSNGTSYSAPILAGAIACFVQSHMDMSPSDVRKIVCMSAGNYLAPDTMLGCGIPDFDLAMALAEKNNELASEENPFYTWPSVDTIYSNIELKTNINPKVQYSFKIKNHIGVEISSGIIAKNEQLIYAERMRFTKNGWYVIFVSDGKNEWKRKLYFEKK